MSNEVQRSLGRIEGALNAIRTGMEEAARRLDNHMADDTRRLDEHDDRIRKTENRLHVYAGTSGILGVIFAAVVDRFIGGTHA